jgi:hypothetical protein
LGELNVNYPALKGGAWKATARRAQVDPRQFLTAKAGRNYVASRYKTDAGMLYPVPDRKAEAFHSKLR